MSSSASPTDHENDELIASLREDLPVSPREQAYYSYIVQRREKDFRFRRWFVETYPISIREYVKTFLDPLSAYYICVLEQAFCPEIVERRLQLPRTP